MKIMNRKGVSPIIAAVLLIAVVVGLGAVVVNIGKTYVTQSQEDIAAKSKDIACAMDVSVDVLLLGDNYDICLEGSNLKFKLESKGKIPIQGARVTTVTDAGVFSGSQDLAAGADDIAVLDVPLNGTGTLAANDIQLIKITPQVKIKGEKMYCTDAILNYEFGVEACSSS